MDVLALLLFGMLLLWSLLRWWQYDSYMLLGGLSLGFEVITEWAVFWCGTRLFRLLFRFCIFHPQIPVWLSSGIPVVSWRNRNWLVICEFGPHWFPCGFPDWCGHDLVNPAVLSLKRDARKALGGSGMYDACDVICWLCVAVWGSLASADGFMHLASELNLKLQICFLLRHTFLIFTR